jgi:hypothetical protein
MNGSDSEPTRSVSAPRLTARFRKAMVYASCLHAGQTRKATELLNFSTLNESSLLLTANSDELPRPLAGLELKVTKGCMETCAL